MRTAARRHSLALLVLLLLGGAGWRVAARELLRDSIERPPTPAAARHHSATPFAALGPGGRETRVVSFETSLARAAVAAFYESELPARGWRRCSAGEPSDAPPDALAAYETELAVWPFPSVFYQLILRQKPLEIVTPTRPAAQLVRLEIRRGEP